MPTNAPGVRIVPRSGSAGRTLDERSNVSSNSEGLLPNRGWKLNHCRRLLAYEAVSAWPLNPPTMSRAG